MKPLIQLKKATPVFLVAVVCFGLLPTMQAVMPAPDGGYGPPAYGAGNTAEGQDALFNLATGVNNTALGFDALYSNTGGSHNTATGFAALFKNTSGGYNTADGFRALYSNTIGANNTANGVQALFSNNNGGSNTATGVNALYANNTGSSNTATGADALKGNSVGYDNTATGYQALRNNTFGWQNTATGTLALLNNTGGLGNTANGYFALGFNSTGSGNTAVGYGALDSNTIGSDNTAIGHVALGMATGSNNTALGHGAGFNVTMASNVICIGADVTGNNVNNSCFIGNIWNQPGGSQAVYVNSLGKLGFQSSSRRFKDEIKPIAQASEVIYGLKPVRFRYKPEIDPTRPLGFGFIAEEVEKISPDLVTRDGDGKVNTVRYDAVNAMLLNEFLKAHKAFVQEQHKVANLQATVAQQQKQIEALIAGLQKVTTQLELNRAAPQTVLNDN